MLHYWNMPIVTIGEYQLLMSQLVLALLILLTTFLLAAVVHRVGRRNGSNHARLDDSKRFVLAQIGRYIVFLLGFLLAVSALGIDVSKLTLVAGALGVGIGLGLQSFVNNFVSGLAIMLERSLKVGDFVELDNGLTGEVVAVNMRATLIRTNDNVDVLIPNSDLTNSRMINWTLEESIRRFRIPVGVAYGSDKELVKKAMLEAAASIPYTLDEPDRRPTVWMTEFGESSLNFVLGVWVAPNQVKRPTALMSDYLWAIDDAFRKYHIQIPFPQRDIHFKTPLLNGDDTLKHDNH